MASPKGYIGLRITFGSTTAVRLLTAVAAVDSNAPTTPRQFSIQSDYVNAAGAYILIGDALLTSTRYGQQLDVGQSRLYPPSSVCPLYGDVYLLASTGSLIADIESMTF